jgi:hypothetical protein
VNGVHLLESECLPYIYTHTHGLSGPNSTHFYQEEKGGGDYFEGWLTVQSQELFVEYQMLEFERCEQ